MLLDASRDGPGPAPSPGWMLAYTRPKMEQTALANLQMQGFETYLPLYKTCRRSAEGLKASFEPMFPRYVFLRPANPRQSVATVDSTRGVCALVRFGYEIARVSAPTVDAIRAFEHERAAADMNEISPIQPGVRVRLQGGLRGLEGLVVAVAGQRVTFLLELLGREKRVTVDHDELVPA